MKFDSALVQEILRLYEESHQNILTNEEEWIAPLFFKGWLAEDTAEQLCHEAEVALEQHVTNRNQKKRLFVTFVEAVQNVRKHALQNEEGRSPAAVTILVSKKENLLRLKTENVVSKQMQQILRERCDAINALDYDEMKQLYMQTMADGEFSDSGGAGLGLITIAMRSKSRLQCNFYHVNENLLIFELFVTVSLAE